MFLMSLASSLDLVIATLLLSLEYPIILLTTGIFFSKSNVSSTLINRINI